MLAKLRKNRPTRRRPPQTKPVLSWWVQLLSSARGGFALVFGFAPYQIWPVALCGMVLIFLGIIGRGFWFSLGSGLLGGLIFWGFLIQWLTWYLGLIPWLALGTFMALGYAIGLAVTAWIAQKLFTTERRSMFWVLPIVFAGVWTLREVIAGLAPYGGFPWARLAFTVLDTNAANLSSWFGITGLSFVLAWLTAIPAVAIWWYRAGRAPSRQSIISTAGAILVTILALAFIPAWGTVTPAQGSVRIAAIQGNANAGLFAEHAPGEWLNNQLAVADEVIASGADFDVMVWPENASDLDPNRSTTAEHDLKDLVTRMDRPLIFGTVTEKAGDYFNSSLLWEPGQGIVSSYDKRHPVPFAEYMPDREFFHAIVPDLVDLVPQNFSFGTKDPVMTTGGVKYGIAICFEIAYDQLLADSINEGAQLILAQTNNADFGYSDESAQQITIAKMQAIANGRSVVNISTVGYSAIFSPSGEVLANVPRFSAEYMVTDVPLQDEIAPGTWAGNVFSGIAGLITISAFLLARQLRRGLREASEVARQE